MFILYINRRDEAHILNFRMNNGNYRMLCGKTWSRSGRYITLAADDTFPGICANCKRRMEVTHKVDLERDLKQAYNAVQGSYYSMRQFHQKGMLGPTDSYEYLSKKASWPKLVKLQKRLTRKKND